MLATSYNNLGLVYSDIGQHEQAKEFHEKGTQYQNKVVRVKNMAMLQASYTNLGIVYSNI
ncbi:hypothetical protein OS493_039546, partial [Desmophyllum pertusum]